MNKNSNTYIIIYSTVLVVIVAAVLATASMLLSPFQNANIAVERKGAVLASVGISLADCTGRDRTACINAKYEKFIVDEFLVTVAGERIEGDAFERLVNLRAEYEKPAEQRQLPLFVSEVDGNRRYIIPLWGSGLWGPVWGYVALESDWNTIYGVVFDHAGETPGLGSEITEPVFTSQFIGKRIFRDDAMVGITVLRGSGASLGNDHAVDALSGGTITARGVENMIRDNLRDYEAFIRKQRAALNAPAVENIENAEENEG